MMQRAWTCALLLSGLPQSAGSQCELARLAASDGVIGDGFGSALAFDGERALIGAPYNFVGPGGPGPGAYLFEATPFGWFETAMLSGSDAFITDGMGSSVALQERTAIVSAPFDDEHGVDSGAVYVFERTAAGWMQVAKLVPSTAGSQLVFGASVALAGDTAVIGHIWLAAAWVFERGPEGWVETQKLVPAGPFSPTAQFGASVACTGTRIVVEAPGQKSVYVFERTDAGWVQAALLSSTASGFGLATSLVEDRILIGSNAAAAFLYEEGPSGWVKTATLSTLPIQFQYWGVGWSVALHGDVALVGAKQTIKLNSVQGSASLFALGSAPCPGEVTLTGSPDSLSLADGGSQTLALDAGTFYAGDFYLLLGSASGTSPGLSIDSALLPLAPDGYQLFTLLSPNSPILPDSFGALDESGAAAAHVSVPAGLDPALGGATLHHAFLVIRTHRGNAHAMEASNAVPLKLVLP